MKAFLALLMLTSVGVQAQNRRAPLISFHDLGGKAGVEVILQLSMEQSNLLADKDAVDFETGKRILDLRLMDPGGKPGPAIFARYQQRGEQLILRPRYPLMTGKPYSATTYYADGSSFSAAKELFTPPLGAPPRVTQIYPSADVLPANCLKFYLYFSQPMRQGREIFEQVVIREAEGKTIEDAWRRTELWNADATRLTLWIHPGRIKQGLNLREDYGPVLLPGKSYRLVLTKGMRDAEGVSLAEDFVHAFQTRAEDRDRPDPAKWNLSHPKPGSHEPMQIRFDKALDRAQLNRFITLHDKDGMQLRGAIQVRENEKVWSFVPDKPWPINGCRVRVDGRLEDLAGNTPIRVFDTDLQAELQGTPVLELPVRLSKP